MSRSRLATPLLAALPLAFLGVFFVYPVVSILALGLAPSGNLDIGAALAVLTPAVRARRRLVHALAGGAVDAADRAHRAARGVRLRAFRLPRPAAHRRARDRALRAADGRRGRRVPGAARLAQPVRHPPRPHDLRHPRRARLLQLRRRAARRGRRVGADRSAPRGRRARPGRVALAGIPARDVAAAAAGDRVGGVGRLPVHVHAASA